MRLLTLLLLCCFTQMPLECSLIDMETNPHDFVLETKQIEVPGYPHAFNPSIVRWNGRLLMSFREIPFPIYPFTSQVGLVWLDDNYNPISEPQILETYGSRSEDARLLTVGDRLYIVYSDNRDFFISRGGFRVYIGELECDGDIVTAHNLEGLFKFQGENGSVREKNWVPFDYHDNLLLAYSLTPHLIFQPLFGSGECNTIATSLCKNDWDWGELRGGTPAIKIGNEYLSFFHSSKDILTVHSNGRVLPHYVMGAYTFNAEPPFEITRISPEPIRGKNFYHGKAYKPYWKSVRVIFPCGILVEEDQIIVAYGRQDHESWIVKIDKQALLDSLIPVETIQK